jgi:hypothetical protein
MSIYCISRDESESVNNTFCDQGTIWVLSIKSIIETVLWRKLGMYKGRVLFSGPISTFCPDCQYLFIRQQLLREIHG